MPKLDLICLKNTADPYITDCFILEVNASNAKIGSALSQSMDPHITDGLILDVDASNAKIGAVLCQNTDITDKQCRNWGYIVAKHETVTIDVG